jgi:hypothetical protein
VLDFRCIEFRCFAFIELAETKDKILGLLRHFFHGVYKFIGTVELISNLVTLILRVDLGRISLVDLYRVSLLQIHLNNKINIYWSADYMYHQLILSIWLILG